MSEEMQPIHPITAALMTGRTPEPCEPITEISRQVLGKLLDVVEFGDQLERVEKDRLLVHLKEVLAEAQPELWATYSPGPGEVHPCLTKEHAEREAKATIDICEKMKADNIARGESVEYWPTVTVDVIPSPYSPLDHFEILAEETIEHRDALLAYIKELEQKAKNASAPAVATPLAITLPMPVMPDEPEDAIDDSWMDGYNAALRMREQCVSAIEAAGHVSAPVVNQQLTTAASDVLAERQRQITAEGWALGHDDEHVEGQMADAAGCYAHAAAGWNNYSARDRWPWSLKWWKPSTPRRNLIKAGALILAEIERLDRAEQAKQQEQQP